MIFKKKRKLYYIIEEADWAIKWVGTYIVGNLKHCTDLESLLTVSAGDYKKSILHFGSRNLYLPDWFKTVHKSNHVVFTWFHGNDDDKVYIKSLPAGSKRADLIHTSCQISKEQLIKWGVDEKKIITIPLGVDLDVFSPVADAVKSNMRRTLNIPDNAVLIGSFQKDGNGWGEGLEPKMIKGPDVFCDVIERLAVKYPVYVFLTGPARGYVKKRLTNANIPYRHIFLKNYHDIATYFNILDLYIIGSRAEGGPLALLESRASGVPLVSTKVGMAPEVIENEVDGLIADIDDVDQLVHCCGRIIDDAELRKSLIINGLQKVKRYTWSAIAQAYYNKIYSKLL